MAKLKTPEAPNLSSSQEAWLLAAAAGAIAPHLPFMPTWLGPVALLLLVWRGFLWWKGLPLPSGLLLALLVAAVGLGVYLNFHRFFGRDPGIALLLCLICLKPLESRKLRDGVLLVFLAWFLQLGLFFYSQSMATAGFAAANLLLSTAALSALNHGTRPPVFILRLAGRMLLQAMPLLLALFLLFPRVQGPLWGLPMDAFTSSSGLSEDMAPGSISGLILSDAVAFRVKFDGRPPAQTQLYWRGPVLSRYDGRTWRPGRTSLGAGLPYAVDPAIGSPFRYTVTLEPHNRNWLFALEFPTVLPADSLMTRDFRLLAKEPVRARQRYTLSSQSGLRTGAAEYPRTLQESLALPAGFNPRARALAAAWRTENPGTTAILARALGFLRGSNFIYTLEPPLLGDNSVDEFLFDTHQGFCEHFSSAFVFLMRAAGVPARVVTGYQGGELNPMDGFLVVRQSDAHAWAEVWMEGEGWRRVDPTAAAAPARVDTGLASAIPRGEPLPYGLRIEMPWLKDLRWRWDALGNGWNQWILGYNPLRQRQLLESLGLPDTDWRKLTALLAASSGVFMLISLAWALRRGRAAEPAQRAWGKLSEKLATLGLARQTEEGPLDYRQRVIRTRPDLAAQMTNITTLYIRCRYAASPHPEQSRRLLRAVAQLKI